MPGEPEDVGLSGTNYQLNLTDVSNSERVTHNKNMYSP